MFACARRFNGYRFVQNVERVGAAVVPIAHRSRISTPKLSSGKAKLLLKSIDPRLVREKKQLKKEASSAGSLKCSGCGALLQNIDPTQIGYLDLEKLEECRGFQRSPATPTPPAVCLRCESIRKYQKLIHVEMKEEEYRKVMTEKITAGRRTLILWLVDIVDFPATLDTNICDVVGQDNPVVLVGTKLDLLNTARKQVEQSVRASMLEGWKQSEASQKCKLVAIHLISAGTSDGVKELIRDIYKQWGVKGDVFVIGSANAGKSTLFNRLLPAMCGVSGAGLAGATVSQWPGTTLRMLRLPILSHDKHRALKEEAMEELARRMGQQQSQGGRKGRDGKRSRRRGDDTEGSNAENEFFELSQTKLHEPVPSSSSRERRQPSPLQSQAAADGMCFYDEREVSDILAPAEEFDVEDVDRELEGTALEFPDSVESDDVGEEAGSDTIHGETEQTEEVSLQLPKRKQYESRDNSLPRVNAGSDLAEKQDESFVSLLHQDANTYLYDTPGLLHSQQTLLFLNPDEVELVVSKSPLLPMTIRLAPGQCVFLGAMGRLDYLQGDRMIYFTVFCASTIPVRVEKIAEADAMYSRRLGNPFLGVPFGDEERLGKFPAHSGRNIDVVGTGWDQSSIDVVLSSVGWVSVTAGAEMPVLLRAHTPGGVGIGVRLPLLPDAVLERGKPLGGTKSFFHGVTGKCRKGTIPPSYQKAWRKRYLSFLPSKAPRKGKKKKKKETDSPASE